MQAQVPLRLANRSQTAHCSQHTCCQARHAKVACQAAPVFEPHIDSQALTAQLLVLSATAATAAYWWWTVVPSARRTLAKEKRSGPFAEYLVDLQQNQNKRLERWFFTDYLQQLQRRQQLAKNAAEKRAAAAQANSVASPLYVVQELPAQQQQVLPPPQQQQQQQGSTLRGEPARVGSGQQQPPVDDGYVDKQPSFWSLDNPILATAALLGGIAAVSSILH